MIGDYLVMDLVTIIGLAATVVTMVGSMVALLRDNKALKDKFIDLSKEHSSLSKEHSRLSDENVCLADKLSKEHDLIKKDTDYVVDTLKLEKRARESLYDNTNQAKEILRTIDIMQEVVVKNYELNQKVSDLVHLNQILMEADQEKYSDLLLVLSNIDRKLSDLENYRESYEIQGVLKSIKNDISKFGN